MAPEGGRGGLAPFDQPLYLQFADDQAGAVEREGAPSTLVARYASVGRVVIALVLIAIAPTRHDDPEIARSFGYMVAFGWLSVVALLDLFQRERPQSRGFDVVSLVWDLALFATTAVVLDAPATVAGGLVLVCAFHAYVHGALFGVAAVVGSGAVMLGGPVITERNIYWSVIVTNLVVATLLVWLVAEAAQRHANVRAGLLRVSEKSEAILAGIGDAVLVTNHRGRVVEWNRAASRTFACSDADAVGHFCDELLDLRHEMRDLRCDRRCGLLDLAPPGTDVEVWRTDAQGRRQPLLATVQPVVARDGTPVEVIHSFRDVTALKQADEAKTLFLATASHELKTPLTVIRGYAQMLQRDNVATSVGTDADTRQTALVAIESRAQQLAGIVDRLLMSSRIEAGRIELHGHATALATLLTERAASLNGATGHRVVAEIAPDIPAAHADPDAITTAVDHLLDNAAKYSRPGSTITVRARSEGDQILIEVQDKGIGMTPEQLEHCFERFWQAESTDVRRFGGTGIGLYIVRSLVEAIDGTVEVRSSAGAGTTFTLRLWAAGKAPQDDEIELVEPSETGGQSSMIREFMRQVGVPLDSAGRR